MTRDQVLREIELSRVAIARDYRSVRAAANFPARVKASIVRRPLPWLGGAAALGWLFAGRRRRSPKKLPPAAKGAPAIVPKEETVKSLGLLTILFSAVRIGFPLLKPVLTAMAAKKIADFASKMK